MAGFAVKDLVKCLTGKLQADEDRSSHHPKYIIYDSDNKIVGITKISHGWRGSTRISGRMRSTIKDQLCLSTNKQLDQIVDCTLSRAQYLEIVESTD